MSDEANVPGGDNQTSGGSADGQKSKDNDNSTDDEGKGTVSYRSHQKVLTEKKNLSERFKTVETELAEMKKERAEADEDELKKQNKWQEAYENTKKELVDQTGKYQTLVEDIHKQRKIGSFLSSLKGQVDSDYHVFIDTEAILADPETGEIDEMSVTKEVERFVKKHPALVQRADKVTTSHYPKGEHSLDKTILRSEWLKLKTSKEMKEWRPEQVVDG